jgi:hypothetical protein
MCAYECMMMEPRTCTFSGHSQIQAGLNATLCYVGVPNVAVDNSTENQHPPSWELQHQILNVGVEQSETDIKAFI